MTDVHTEIDQLMRKLIRSDDLIKSKMLQVIAKLETRSPSLLWDKLRRVNFEVEEKTIEKWIQQKVLPSPSLSVLSESCVLSFEISHPEANVHELLFIAWKIKDRPEPVLVFDEKMPYDAVRVLAGVIEYDFLEDEDTAMSLADNFLNYSYVVFEALRFLQIQGLRAIGKTSKKHVRVVIAGEAIPLGTLGEDGFSLSETWNPDGGRG